MSTLKNFLFFINLVRFLLFVIYNLWISFDRNRIRYFVYFSNIFKLYDSNIYDII